MPDLLTWPADLLLGIGAGIAGWFVSKDEPSFEALQMMLATLVLAALVASIVYGQTLAELVRSALQARRKRRHS
jgi:ABC-type amino acid transport system permease subunit